MRRVWGLAGRAALVSLLLLGACQSEDSPRSAVASASTDSGEEPAADPSPSPSPAEPVAAPTTAPVRRTPVVPEAPVAFAFVDVARQASEPPAATPLLAQRAIQGGRIIVTRTDDPSGGRKVLVEGFAGVRDPQPDADATHVVFSGQRASGDRWQIWRVPIEGGAPERAFQHDGDCFRPAPMFGGRIAFVATGPGSVDTSGYRETTALYIGDPATGVVDRTSYGPGPFLDPTVLADGRVGFSALRRSDRASLPAGRAAIYATNWDGTNFVGVHGVYGGPRMRHHATSLDDGWLAYLASEDVEDVTAGDLVIVSQYDPVPPPSVLPDDGGRYAGVTDLGGGVLLASYQPRDALGHGLYLVDRDTGGRAQLLAPEAGRDMLDPVALRRSPHFLSRFSLNREDRPYGWLFGQDVRRGGRAPRDGRAPGAGSAGFLPIPKDTDGLRVRVIVGTPVGAEEAAARRRSKATEGTVPVVGSPPVMHQAILGEAPVEPDGSFYIKAPADRPLRLQLVDAQGRVLRSERGWQWLRPNQSRGCVGCHLDPQLAPRNERFLATTKPPVDLSAVERPERVDFLHTIGPRVNQTCAVAGCHVGPRPTGGLSWAAEPPSVWCRRVTDGHVFRCPPAYARFLSPRDGVPAARGGRLLHPGAAMSSPIPWMMFGRQLGPQEASAPFDRPLGQPHPAHIPDGLRRLFAAWVELGAPLESRPAQKEER